MAKYAGYRQVRTNGMMKCSRHLTRDDTRHETGRGALLYGNDTQQDRDEDGLYRLADSMARDVLADPPKRPSPDAELIRLCDRLVAISDEERRLYATIEDEHTRNTALQPLTDEWTAIRTKLYEMDRPATSEGERSVALAAQANADSDPDHKVMASDLADWLALATCAYLTGTAAPIPEP
jgi:hypothetical protein